jgi:enamine deaminase RidA (YjgF/YER057c/UK114 family)
MWHTYSTGSQFEQVAPYSRAMHNQEWVFVSGTTGFDYTTMTLADGVAEQCRQAWRNVAATLQACGSDLGEIVQYLMVLTDPADLETVGEIMTEVRPTRPVGIAFCAALVDPRLRYEVQVTARRGLTIAPQH